jgi:hypothetical protein
LLLLLLLLGVFACVLPAVPQVDQNAAATAVQGTLNAIIKQTEDAGQPIVDTETDTPQPTFTGFPTFTPIVPTPTFTPTATYTLPPPPVSTNTPTYPMVSVSIATNCRSGPGKLYTLMGYLQENVWVRVYARDAGTDYWYIRNPANSSQFCWIWGEYATVIGSLSQLPVYTPPPSPTPTMTSTPVPGFDVTYVGLQSCTGKFWADLKLRNTGTTAFRSVSITVVDTVTKASLTVARDMFVDFTGCNSSTKDTLQPGKALIASAPRFAYNPDGHKINATVTLCTGLGMNGYCKTVKLSFKP